mgnify:FL=1
MKKTCDTYLNVSEEEGFARTPGYPSYYVGETNCKWMLKSSPLQRIKITFLDVSIRNVAPHEMDCLDKIIVSENGLNLLTACGDSFENVVVLSSGSSLNVSFVTQSKNLFPKRGILFHYKGKLDNNNYL